MSATAWQWGVLRGIRKCPRWNQVGGRWCARSFVSAPPRLPGTSEKSHLLAELEGSPLGKILKEKAAPEARSEYVVLKSVISYLWDSIRFLKDWQKQFGQGGGEDKPVAVKLVLRHEV